MDSAADKLAKAQALFDAERYDQALALLEPLADAGVPEALSVLGCIYQLGLGVSPDGGRAEALLLMAAEKGVGIAAHNLATLYATGLPGFPRRPEFSMHYYRLARSLGFQPAPDSFYE